MNGDSALGSRICNGYAGTIEEQKDEEEKHYAYAVCTENQKNYISPFCQFDEHGYIYKEKFKVRFPDWKCEICPHKNQGLLTSCLYCGAARPLILEPHPLKKFLDSLKPGSLFDCKDMRGVWYPAKVIDRSGNDLLVHFRGWKDCFNEIIDLKNPETLNRIGEYHDYKDEYGLYLYTKQYFSKERLEKFLEAPMRLIRSKTHKESSPILHYNSAADDMSRYTQPIKEESKATKLTHSKPVKTKTNRELTPTIAIQQLTQPIIMNQPIEPIIMSGFTPTDAVEQSTPTIDVDESTQQIEQEKIADEFNDSSTSDLHLCSVSS